MERQAISVLLALAGFCLLIAVGCFTAPQATGLVLVVLMIASVLGSLWLHWIVTWRESLMPRRRRS